VRSIPLLSTYSFIKSFDVLAAIIRMKTLDRDVKMACNPVEILLDNDNHRPSGLILNCIDKQVFADICKGDEAFCVVVSNNGQFPADIGEIDRRPLCQEEQATWSSTMQGFLLDQIRCLNCIRLGREFHTYPVLLPTQLCDGLAICVTHTLMPQLRSLSSGDFGCHSKACTAL
jgi:hypothetical protein